MKFFLAEDFFNVLQEFAGKDLTVHLGVDIKGDDKQKIRYGNVVYQTLKDYRQRENFSENTILLGGVRQVEYETYYADNGSLLFIGIFLGSLFLMETAMIFAVVYGLIYSMTARAYYRIVEKA